MAYQDCINIINAAAGRPLTPDEITDLTSELQSRERAKLAEGKTLSDAAREAAVEWSAEIKTKAKMQRRNAAFMLKTKLQTIDKVRTQFGKNYGLGLESVLVGVNNAAKGARNSAALEMDMLHETYLAGLTNDLMLSGHLPIFTSGAMDREIANAMWALNRETPLPTNVPQEAIDIAKIAMKWQEMARRDQNKAGAWIKKMDGWIVRQSHDAWKIMGKGDTAAYKEWRDFILPQLDMARTLSQAGLEPADAEKFLKDAWNAISSGVHLRAPETASGVGMPGSLAKKVSAERVLHFKDANAWFDYNARFGMRNVREAIAAGLTSASQNAGLMRVLGPNPEMNLNDIFNTLMRGIDDPAKRRDFEQAFRGKLDYQYKEISGYTKMPVSHIGAAWASSFRAGQNMAKLGLSIASQFSDVAIYGSEVRYQGGGMLSGVAESLGAVVKGVRAEERAPLLKSLSVYVDSMNGQIANRFSLAEEGMPGLVARMQQRFFKMNLMRWWSDSQRTSSVIGMASRLASVADKDLASLHPDLARTLSLYGIGKEQWNIARQAITEHNGERFVAPEAVEALPDSAFLPLLARDGIKPTPTRIATARREVADQLRRYFVDRSSFAQLEPDARTRAMMTMGTRPGTWDGEFWRFTLQFKAFSYAMLNKTIGREIYGRGAAADAGFFKALASGNGEWQGLANIIVWTTAFGYLSMSTKDLIKGKKPRNPLDWRTWVASAAQGGGVGIYGDFLFGEYNRFSGGIITSLAGPTAGTINDVYNIYQTLRDQNTPHPQREAAAQTFAVAINNTPFVNLFYTRMVLDYLILNRITEWLSPGALRRREGRIKRQNDQEFFLRPSQNMLGAA